MNKINIYLFKLSFKYIFINLSIITLFVIFINIIEISRILEKDNQNLYFYIYLTFLKVPSIINQTIPFVIIVSTAFLFRNLINNNELVSIRNIGLSIFDIFKPVSLSILCVGLLILLIINPLSANFEYKMNETLNKKLTDIYSIKISKSGMWIKNQISEKKNQFYKYIKF